MTFEEWMAEIDSRLMEIFGFDDHYGLPDQNYKYWYEHGMPVPLAINMILEDQEEMLELWADL